jgi:hypothetical protein
VTPFEHVLVPAIKSFPIYFREDWRTTDWEAPTIGLEQRRNSVLNLQIWTPPGADYRTYVMYPVGSIRTWFHMALHILDNGLEVFSWVDADRKVSYHVLLHPSGHRTYAHDEDAIIWSKSSKARLCASHEPFSGEVFDAMHRAMPSCMRNRILLPEPVPASA